MASFNYSCAHSLRSPLKSIAGLLNLLENDDESQNRYIDLILESLTRLDIIADQFNELALNFNRVVRMDRIALDDFMEKRMEEVSSLLTVRGFSFGLSVNKLGPFYSDQARLQVVMRELFKNAIQFRKGRPEDLHIKVLVTSSRQGCSIQVHDNGVGIPKHISPNVFKMFYRGSNRSQGVGLGLYIVQRVLQSLNGSVTVGSIEGMGSVLSVWIPNGKVN